MLTVRRENNLADAELIEVAKTNDPAFMILLFRQKISSKLQLLAVNFGKRAVYQKIEKGQFRHTTAIDLMENVALSKPINSSTLEIKLEPQSYQLIGFQQKYYD